MSEGVIRVQGDGHAGPGLCMRGARLSAERRFCAPADCWLPRRSVRLRAPADPHQNGHYALRSRYRFVVRRRVWDAARMCPHGRAWGLRNGDGTQSALANVVRAWSDAGHWATAVDGQGMKADIPYHVPSETR
jgi:hypothetical protein